MNKKFSTLVAALLVSGVSYAVVDTFNSYAMTNSPVAKAAAANVTRAAANYSVNALKASEGTLAADNVLWNVSGEAGSYVFKTKAGSALGKDANGIILRNSNLPVEGAEDLKFAWVDNHLTTDGGANVLVISKAQDEIKLVPVGNVDLVNYTYATLFLGDNTQLTAGIGATPGTYYKIGAEVKSWAVGENAIQYTASMTTPAFKTGTSFTNNLTTVLQSATDKKVTLEYDEVDNVRYLKLMSSKGTSLYLNVNADGSFSFTEKKPSGVNIASSNVTLDATTNQKAVMVGGKYLLNNVSWQITGTWANNTGCYLYDTGNDLVANSDLENDNKDYYLLNVTADAATFNASSTGTGTITGLGITPGASDADVAISTTGDQATQIFELKKGVSSFTLSNGYEYLSTTPTGTVEKDDATVAQFALDPVDGAIMNGSNYLLRATTGGALSLGTDLTGKEKLYLYSASEITGAPVNALLADLTEGNYVIANTTYAIAPLGGDSRVIVSTEDAGTPDVPAAGAKELINGANYFINDGTNYLAYVDGELTNDDSHSASDKTEMWIATEHKGTNGEPTTYSFVNRSTEKGKLAFKVELKNNVFPAEATFDAEKGTYTQFFIDKDGKVSFTAKATNKAGQAVEQVYYLNFDGTDWKFITDNSNVQNINFNRTDEGMALNANYLNKLAGNGSDFSFLFAANAKRDSLKPLNETVLSKTITAVDGSDYNGVFQYYVGNENASAYTIDGMLFSTSLSNASTETGIKKVIENFRASKFIIVDPTAYSSIIEDKDNNQFFDYIEVSGSDLVDENGVLLTDPDNYDADDKDIKDGKALAGVKYVFSNAIFKAQQRQGAQYSDPVYVTTPSAYYNPETNEDGLAGFEAVTELAIAVKKFQGTYYVGAAYDQETVTPRWEYVYIGTNNDVTYKQVNGIVNIFNARYNSKGEVYANTANNSIDKFDPKYTTINTNAPEGQFLVTYENNKFTFTNRESSNVAFNGSYGLKTVKDAKGNVVEDVYAVANGTNYSTPDTIKIVSAMPESKYDGYKNFDQKKYELTDSIYTMSFLPKVDGKEGLDRVYVAENHDTDHMLTLTTDEGDATKFSLIKFEGEKDTVYVSTGKYITADGKLVDDKAVAFAYTIYNDDNSEYVEYESATTKEYFYCDWRKDNLVNEEPLKQKAQRYILKDKGNNNYQMIAIRMNKRDYSSEDPTKTLPNTFKNVQDGKAYGAFQAPKISQEANIYKVTDNDIINISVIGAPMYRTVEAAPFDTIRIYKEGSKNVALYAQSADQKIVSGSNFLAMGHNADVNTDVTKFSLFVDTAYVRGGTNKPQYMLAIEPDTIHGKYDCGVPSHDLHDSGKIDTVYGKYMITMIDSIPAWGNKHNNPYYWEENVYPRLGFVNAKHYGDSLVILNDNGIQTVKDTIDLKDNSNKFGVYAFRIVNDDTKAFIIETAYDRKADGSFTTGWIKWLNGVPVVIPNGEKDKAEIFSLEATSNDPVANESINGAATFSVATRDGAVVISGAEGKTVVITNVLGQTVANTVITSSEAIIAVPAGVVVVAVEGEAAVKAIVK